MVLFKFALVKVNMKSSTMRFSIKKTIGPGLLLAGAAIGVSHLVQATRAGADYGFALWWVLLFACLTKYPFLEFGPRYAAATGTTLIAGYRNLGLLPYWTYVFITFGTMFIIQAAVTIVTAGLAEQLFQLGFNNFIWSVIILGTCILLLMIGRYKALDISMKIIISILSIGTLLAVILAFGVEGTTEIIKEETITYKNLAALAFIVAFIGWMPIPIDASVWHSIWVREKSRQSGYEMNLKEALFDFNAGYIIAAIMGLLFFLLGALIMFGSGSSFSSNSVTFSAQLVEMYGNTLGEWSKPLISIAAFTAMLSTTLAVTDAFPRVIAHLYSLQAESTSLPSYRRKVVYNFSLILIPIVAVSILFFMSGSFTMLVDFAAGLSFLSAPILAWFNYTLVTGKHMPKEFRPGKYYKNFSFICFLALSAFALSYLYLFFIIEI